MWGVVGGKCGGYDENEAEETERKERFGLGLARGSSDAFFEKGDSRPYVWLTL